MRLLRPLAVFASVVGAFLAFTGQGVPQTAPRVLAIEFENDVNPVTADYLVVGLFPRSLASVELRDATRAWLSSNQDASPALRRLVHENLADVERALAAQSRDAED